MDRDLGVVGLLDDAEVGDAVEDRGSHVEHATTERAERAAVDGRSTDEHPALIGGANLAAGVVERAIDQRQSAAAFGDHQAVVVDALPVGVDDQRVGALLADGRAVPQPAGVVEQPSGATNLVPEAVAVLEHRVVGGDAVVAVVRHHDLATPGDGLCADEGERGQVAAALEVEMPVVEKAAAGDAQHAVVLQRDAVGDLTEAEFGQGQRVDARGDIDSDVFEARDVGDEDVVTGARHAADPVAGRRPQADVHPPGDVGGGDGTGAGDEDGSGEGATDSHGGKTSCFADGRRGRHGEARSCLPGRSNYERYFTFFRGATFCASSTLRCAQALARWRCWPSQSR